MWNTGIPRRAATIAGKAAVRVAEISIAVRPRRVRGASSTRSNICHTWSPNDGGPDPEVDIGRAHAEVREEDVAQALIVVLARVDEDVLAVLVEHRRSRG